MLEGAIDQLFEALNADGVFRAKFSEARSFDEAATIAEGRGCAVSAADLEAWIAQSTEMKTAELSEQELDAVAGGSKQRESLMISVLTNIANMKHEALKGIVQNLRG